MFRRSLPGLVGDAAAGIGDSGALLGELKSGALGLGEDGCISPCSDQVEPAGGFPGVGGGSKR
jgi:hypothetical protein